MKQKLVSILLVLCMVVALVPAIVFTSAAANTVEDTNKDGTLPEGAEVLTGTATAFSGGDGSAEDPYQIKDITEFRYLQNLLCGTEKETYLTKSYILIGNIYFNVKFNDLDADGNPAGTQFTGVTRYDRNVSGNQVSLLPGIFTGTFDGGNYGLYNVYARFSNPGGLFQTLSGTVKNVNLYGGNMCGGANLGSITSALAGGTIQNCYSSVNLYGKSSPTGGLVGIVSGGDTNEIIGCTYAGKINASSISGTGQVGGIIARAERDFTVKNSKNFANITTACNRVGGIVAMLMTNTTETVIEGCANYGTITTTSTASSQGGVAGVFGYLHSGTGSIRIANCANFGDITSNGAIATGISCIGGATHAFSNCANYGNVKGSGASGITPTIRSYSKGFYSSGTVTNLSSDASGILFGNVWGSNGNNLDYCVAVGTGAAYQAKNSTNTGTPVVYAPGAVELTDGTAVNLLNTDNAGVWVQGAKGPELAIFYTAPEITIDGASLTIGENVTLNLFVKTETIRNAGVTVKTISIVDNGNKSYEVTDDSGDYYVFTIEGLSAKEFGTNKTYHVQYTTADAPGTPIDCTATKEYSPLQYAINMYGKTDKAGLDALLLSIVNYADAAAGTTTAKAAFDEKHADADWTAVTALTEIVKEDKDSGSYSYDAKTMPRIGASLTETIELTVYLKDTAYTGVTMKVGDTELTGTADEAAQTVKFEGFWATDLYNEITLTFTGAEGTEPLEATTSLVQYLNRYAGNETYAKVATATAQYLYAARNFCLKNRTNA